MERWGLFGVGAAISLSLHVWMWMRGLGTKFLETCVSVIDY